MTKEEMALVRKEVNDNIRANYGELAKFLSDGIFQLLNCVISFGINSPVTKDCYQALKEYFQIIGAENDVLRYIKRELKNADVQEVYLLLDEITDLNEDTFIHYDSVMEEFNLAWELNNPDRARRPKKNFNTIIEDYDIQSKAIGLKITLDDIKEYLGYEDAFWEYIKPYTRIADSFEPEEYLAKYKDDKFEIVIPPLVNLENANIAIKQFNYAFEVYTAIKYKGLPTVYPGDVVSEHEYLSVEFLKKKM